jgi:ppGpp synthetase/RelA/SpoT-type nucleotidyltranferase
MENRASQSDFDQAFIDEFDSLYDRYVEDRFPHALSNLTRALNALLDEQFPPSQRMRVRVEAGRIKGQNRLLLKAQTDKYRPAIGTPADVFVVIRDIVGTRVTCNTLADVYVVVNVIKSCATSDNAARTLSKLHVDWEDDYILEPKDTGYRAINLIVGVPVPRGGVMERLHVRSRLERFYSTHGGS